MRRIAAVPRRLANAFTVLFGQRGAISREARQTGQTRQSMYRDAQQIVEQVSNGESEAEIARLREQLAQERTRADALAARLSVPPFVRYVGSTGRQRQSTLAPMTWRSYGNR